jgi:predicted RND superfamily exporter protein
VIVCLTPIGVLTTNFNAAFLGLNRPGLAALTTYLSTFIYFVTLAFFGFKGILWIGILLGVILNQFSELVLLRLLFSRARMQL